MSLEPMDALSPDLLALLDDERARPMAPEVDPDALFDALSESLDLDAPTETPTDAARPPTTNAPTAPDAPPTASLSASATAAAKLGALKVAGLATAFALGGLTGAGTYATLRRPERVVVERVVRVPVERVVQVPVERVVRVEVPVAAMPVTAPVTAPVRARVEAAPETDLDREIALIDQATAALARDNHAAALASVREHLRRFPEGAMREDRERLWIDALVRSGRRDEALARAAEFDRRFPDSVHRARIARALAEPPPE
ncbi:MAG: hypothetical protein U0326_19575 [Polyangiales bacterium]